MNTKKILQYISLIVIGALIVYLIISKIDSSYTTPSGIEVNYIKQGEGNTIQDGNIIIFDLEYYDHEDSLILKKTGDDPVVLMKDSTWNYGGVIYEVVSSFKEGDSVTFKISTEDFYANSPNAVSIPDSIKEKLLTFYCGVKEIMSQDEFQEYQKEQYEKQYEKMQNEMNKQNENQLPIDLEIIRKYLESNKIEALSTDSGLRYIITEEGDGVNPPVGSKVKVHYSGTLLDGTKFDSSYDRGEPFTFELGVGQVIKGWDEGIALLSKGSKGVLYIPSTLAYGSNGAGGIIPPNAVLIFEVELVDFE